MTGKGHTLEGIATTSRRVHHCVPYNRVDAPPHKSEDQGQLRPQARYAHEARTATRRVAGETLLTIVILQSTLHGLKVFEGAPSRYKDHMFHANTAQQDFQTQEGRLQRRIHLQLRLVRLSGYTSIEEDLTKTTYMEHQTRAYEVKRCQ